MESLSDTVWDVVICGTGLQQSLLSLALSRSDKKILHIDPNHYYGGAEAALTLDDADAWASEIVHAQPTSSSIFTDPTVTRCPSAPETATALGPSRSYALALAPQILHGTSALLSQLVSSRAYRQLEFLAVGAFFVLQPNTTSQDNDTAQPETTTPVLTRIPSTREDVFSSRSLTPRAKRHLMKLLKLVLSYDEEPRPEWWHDFADRPLDEFLHEHMGLDDASLRSYIAALTLSLHGGARVATRDALAAVHRHLISMGRFGPGFAAVYPKWGGASEIAQVGCRAGAVGGAVYMLGSGIKEMRREVTSEEDGEKKLVEVELTDGTVVKTRTLVRGAERVDETSSDAVKVSRMVAIVDAPLPPLFETTMEGAPTPAVAVVALPPGATGESQTYPVYAMAHSSETGECPAGQSVLYLTTLHTPASRSLLQTTLTTLLSALADGRTPQCLYQVCYEQQSTSGSAALMGDGLGLDFPAPAVTLSFEDAQLDPVRQAWERVAPDAAADENVEYMVFADREAVGDEDEYD